MSQESPALDAVEKYFKSLLEFLRMNAKGEVAVVALIQSESKQFWINAMVQDEIWVRGMIDSAKVFHDGATLRGFLANGSFMEEQIKQQDLMATEVKGKAQ